MTEQFPTPDHLTDTNPEQSLSLEDQIRRKFVGVTTGRLIQRMEQASDEANLDDETYEMSRRMHAQGKTWRWTGDLFNPRIEVADAGEVQL